MEDIHMNDSTAHLWDGSIYKIKACIVKTRRIVDISVMHKLYKHTQITELRRIPWMVTACINEKQRHPYLNDLPFIWVIDA